ncbi:hypothetical protein [Nocardia sp. NPDC004860]|uniref:hypothetical protein n=1 Tax=Nocardia sp. NPDC004860 TaxID=3154557 RepID=UPI0033BE1CA7
MLTDPLQQGIAVKILDGIAGGEHDPRVLVLVDLSPAIPTSGPFRRGAMSARQWTAEDGEAFINSLRSRALKIGVHCALRGDQPVPGASASSPRWLGVQVCRESCKLAMVTSRARSRRSWARCSRVAVLSPQRGEWWSAVG